MKELQAALFPKIPEKIQLINYEPITPFNKIVLSENILGVKPKAALFHSAQEDQNDRLKNFKSYFSSKLQSLDLTIDSIEHFNWQERYILSGNGGEELILNIKQEDLEMDIQ